MELRASIQKCVSLAILGANVVFATATFAADSSSYTFARDVAPIVFENCSGCHRPGQGAPFSLLTYRDFQKRGDLISHVVETGQMPPWKAGAGDYAFRGDRRLTESQRNIVLAWIEHGMPEGESGELPSPPVFSGDWRLGEPDLVLEMPEAFDVPAEGPDIYRNFVLPLALNEDRWVRAIDFRPSAPDVVHHSLFFFATEGKARELDKSEPGPGFGGGMGGVFRLRFGDQSPIVRLLAARKEQDGDPNQNAPLAQATLGFGPLGGWALGKQPQYLKDDLAFSLPAGSDLILSTHFHPSGKAEREVSKVGLYFGDKPRQRFTNVQLPPAFGAFKAIDIAPENGSYRIEDEFVMPIDAKAFMCGAHAHYLGKSMTLTATFPDGAEKTILSIPDWDFSWQEQYEFADYVELPKGTRLRSRITYDNTSSNPRNPRVPPQRVQFGEGSNDEMGSVGLQMIAVDPAELKLLEAAFREHVRSSLLQMNPIELWNLQQKLKR